MIKFLQGPGASIRNESLLQRALYAAARAKDPDTALHLLRMMTERGK